MSTTWGTELWDRLDDVVDHSNNSSVLIDKCHKTFVECHQIWYKAASKQKRLLEKLQQEFSDPFHTEFSLTSSLLVIINNFLSICSINSTYAESSMKTSEEYFKKTHSQIKKQMASCINDKRKYEDELYRERKKYELSLRRYREKYQALIQAQDLCKKAEQSRNLSRSQIDLTLNTKYYRQSDYDQSKQEYAVQLRDFNQRQQSHWTERIPTWSALASHLYGQRLQLVNQYSTAMAKLTGELARKYQYPIERFNDVPTIASDIAKDTQLLVQRYKTGDVPPQELQFIDLDQIKPSRSSSHQLSQTLGLTVSEDNCSDTINSSSSSTSSSCSSSCSSSQHQTASQSKQAVSPGNSFNLSANEPPESKPSVHSIKQRANQQTSKSIIINRGTINSFHRAPPLFKSHVPWNKSTPIGHLPEPAPTSIYQRKPQNRSRMPSRRNEPPQGSLLSFKRSRSVSDIITSVVRSSLRLRPSNSKNKLASKSAQDNPQVTSNTTRRSSVSGDSFTEDSSDDAYEPPPDGLSSLIVAGSSAGGGRGDGNNILPHRKYSTPTLDGTASVESQASYKSASSFQPLPQIVSTPAEAVAMSMSQRPGLDSIKYPEPDYDGNNYEEVDGDVSSATNHSSATYYIGSCVSEYDYEGEHTDQSESGPCYLSFKAGDQFYICSNLQASDCADQSEVIQQIKRHDWILVDTIPPMAHGYVPSSFMKIRLFIDDISLAPEE